MAHPQNIYSLDTVVAENSAVFADLISAASPTIAPNGAIEGNIARSENVSFQRNADYTALLGLQEDSAGDIAAAISAMQYAFNQEQADGSFSNPQLASAGAYNNASADAFFLQSFAQICLDLKNSPLWPTFSSQIQAFRPQFSKAMAGSQARHRSCLRATPRFQTTCSSTLSPSSLAETFLTTIASIRLASGPHASFFLMTGSNLKLEEPRSRLTRSARRMRRGNKRGACEFEFRLSIGRAQSCR
jgi:hypothetical protein